MLSLVGLSALGLAGASGGVLEKRKHAQAIPTAADPRATGANFASSITADRATIGARQPAMPMYQQPAPNTLRHHPVNALEPDQDLQRRHLLAQALPEGPWTFRGGRAGYDRYIAYNRLPHHHPGLTRLTPTFSGGPLPMRITDRVQ
jgi:hypothetical protein